MRQKRKLRGVPLGLEIFFHPFNPRRSILIRTSIVRTFKRSLKTDLRWLLDNWKHTLKPWKWREWLQKKFRMIFCACFCKTHGMALATFMASGWISQNWASHSCTSSWEALQEDPGRATLQTSIRLNDHDWAAQMHPPWINEKLFQLESSPAVNVPKAVRALNGMLKTLQVHAGKFRKAVFDPVPVSIGWRKKKYLTRQSKGRILFWVHA